MVLTDRTREWPCSARSAAFVMLRVALSRKAICRFIAGVCLGQRMLASFSTPWSTPCMTAARCKAPGCGVQYVSIRYTDETLHRGRRP
jgi:hypothetical protein